MNHKNTYRWIVLIIACLINLCIGSVYAWSVFANPLAEYISTLTGVSIANLSIVFTITNAVGPITMISGGFINDKIGARWLLIIGGILFGGGMMLSGSPANVGMLIFSYSILGGLGVGLVYGCTVSSPIKLFPDKKGLIGGITTAAYGISSVIIPPIANALIGSYNVTVALRVIGGVMALIIVGGSFIFSYCFKKAQELVTKSAPDVVKFNKSKHHAASLDSATPDYNWIRMIKEPYFYIMLIMLCAGAVSGLMITSQASPLAQKLFMLTPTQASVVVSILALFNTAGRLVSGFSSDRFGIIKTLRGTFILFVIGQALLSASVSLGSAVFVCGVCIVGLCFGSIMGIYPGFTAKKYGYSHNSVNYGIMFIGCALAGYIGPLLLNVMYNSFGSYRVAFLAAAVLAIIGLGLTFVNREQNM